MLNGNGASSPKIEIIPHGIPDFPFVGPDSAKTNLGFENSTVLLTFGLLSPNKGIEAMIDAMPAVLASRPNSIYVVLVEAAIPIWCGTKARPIAKAL